MGAMLATLFRSGPPAIGVGIAYPILVEGLLGLALPAEVLKWLPGRVLSAVAAGGAPPIVPGQVPGLDYGMALVVMALYVVAFGAVSFVLLSRRDVN